MITFVNKEIENLKENEGLMTYANFSILCLNAPLQQGMTVEDIEQRIQLRGKFRGLKPKEELEITEEECNLLVKCKKNMKWGIVHEAIPAYSKYIDNLKPKEESESKKISTEA